MLSQPRANIVTAQCDNHPLAHYIYYILGSLTSTDAVYAVQTAQQRQVLSYPDGDQFLNVARNPRSPFYSPDLAVGEWKELPASAAVSKL